MKVFYLLAKPPPPPKRQVFSFNAPCCSTSDAPQDVIVKFFGDRVEEPNDSDILCSTSDTPQDVTVVPY